MLELHQFAPAFGLPNASPPCMKVETYLRLADIDYKIVPVADPGKGPYGKAPWIIDEGKTIPDSRFIIDHLNDRHNHPLKGSLDEKDLAVHDAIGRTLDESTYWVLVHERWVVPENVPIIREALFASVPGPLRKLVFSIGQRGIKKALHGQGTGRLSREEVISLGKRDIDNLVIQLGNNPYFGGNKAAQIDATTFAYIANFIKAPISSPVSDYVRENDKLVAYCERMMSEIFPEYASQQKMA